MSGSPDVVVIGAGVAGLASAWRLAQRGAAVTVVDPTPGAGASGVAAGMLAPVTEARLGEEELLRLSLASWSLWPDFAAEVEKLTGLPIGYRADGTLLVALDADDRAALEELVERQRALGLEVTTVRGHELWEVEPGLAPAVRAGALAAGERSVDPPALVDALAVAAERAGAVIRPSAVDRLVVGERSKGTVGGVSLEGGERIVSATVVLAAGSWSGRIGGLPDAVRPPIRPVKGQVVILRQPGGDPLIGHTVRGFVRGSVVYLVPRDDGRIVAGATVEERGWDMTVTAGAGYELLRDVLALMPGLDDAELVGVRAGLRPATPDGLPLIGRSAVDGLVLATGHFRNGILLAPITAEAVAAAVAGDPMPDSVTPCDPGRFTRLAALAPQHEVERGQNGGPTT